MEHNAIKILLSGLQALAKEYDEELSKHPRPEVATDEDARLIQEVNQTIVDRVVAGVPSKAIMAKAKNFGFKGAFGSMTRDGLVGFKSAIAHLQPPEQKPVEQKPVEQPPEQKPVEQKPAAPEPAAPEPMYDATKLFEEAKALFIECQNNGIPQAELLAEARHCGVNGKLQDAELPALVAFRDSLIKRLQAEDPTQAAPAIATDKVQQAEVGGEDENLLRAEILKTLFKAMADKDLKSKIIIAAGELGIKNLNVATIAQLKALLEKAS